LSKLRKIDKHELTLLGCLLCLQVPNLACILAELLQRQTAGTQISGSLMRMYAHLLRNTCKILLAPCHLSSCALPPQDLRHGQTWTKTDANQPAVQNWLGLS